MVGVLQKDSSWSETEEEFVNIKEESTIQWTKVKHYEEEKEEIELPEGRRRNRRMNGQM